MFSRATNSLSAWIADSVPRTVTAQKAGFGLTTEIPGTCRRKAVMPHASVSSRFWGSAYLDRRDVLENAHVSYPKQASQQADEPDMSPRIGKEDMGMGHNLEREFVGL